MKTAYLCEVSHGGKPCITEFSYEKRTGKMYIGCKAVGYIVGRGFYLSSRLPHEAVREDLGDALRLAAEKMRDVVENRRRELNDALSRLGDVERVAEHAQEKA